MNLRTDRGGTTCSWSTYRVELREAWIRDRVEEEASKNPNHQYIHLKFCHRACITPRMRHQMKLTQDPFCSFCPQQQRVFNACCVVVSWSFGSGVHRLFEGQGQKYCTFLPLKRALQPMIWLPREHFNGHFGPQEGSLSCFSMFCQPRGHFSMHFGFQEGTVACVLAPERTLQCMFWLPRRHFSVHFSIIGPRDRKTKYYCNMEKSDQKP